MPLRGSWRPTAFRARSALRRTSQRGPTCRSARTTVTCATAARARDGWICQYCGSDRPGLSVDHVSPRSRGGESVWETIVASCAPCNRKTGNRLPQEIRMHPKRRPRAPGPTVFIRIAAPRTPTAWEPYLLVV